MFVFIFLIFIFLIDFSIIIDKIKIHLILKKIPNFILLTIFIFCTYQKKN